MPIVGKVGRKRMRARGAMLLLYCLLVIGAVTMVYPFLLMAGTGFAGPTDQNDNKVIPAYWSDSAKLEEKYLFDKYGGNQSDIDSVLHSERGDPADLAVYQAFLEDLSPNLWTAGFRTAAGQITGKLAMRYQSWLKTKFSSVDEMNKRYLSEDAAFQSVVPPAEQYDRIGWKPRPGPKWDDWLEFKKSLPAEYRIPIRLERMYQNYTHALVQGQIDSLPADVKGSAKTFEEVRRQPGSPADEEFLQKSVPEPYRSSQVEARWSEISANPMPVALFDKQFASANAAPIKSEFTWRNYSFIFDYIALNGQALWNTLILCGLTILLQLLVNPLAAYALSRYPMPATAKILIFLLAAMAFPAEVALIPSFLLLKDLHLLNTFWALVLPTAASGYMIFLLKGFFDSLPQELFESGQIDGAKDATMLWKIALPLSKPVLGYLALLAFMGSYGAFMYAFLVAQDRSMWTLMVFIYNLQSSAPKAVMMAGLTLAAIPTLLVFLMCQRVIMRGIVLPGER